MLGPGEDGVTETSAVWGKPSAGKNVATATTTTTP
jgi:hypothetical protein